MNKKEKSLRSLCVIPARGGSKGIPKKNLTLIKGSSLLSYTIKQAKESRVFDYIHVSTDCEHIMDDAIKNGASCEFLRPQNFATNKIGTAPSIVHSIEELNKKSNRFDYVYELQPTYLFRSVDTIKNIHKKLSLKKSICTVRKVESTAHPEFICSAFESGKLKLGSKKPDNFARQELSPFYAVIGVVLASPVSLFKKYNSFYHEDTYFHLIEKKIELFDINDELDLKIAKNLFEK